MQGRLLSPEGREEGRGQALERLQEADPFPDDPPMTSTQLIPQKMNLVVLATETGIACYNHVSRSKSWLLILCYSVQMSLLEETG